ncbi:hypothetical protein HZH66_008673 [Vespula vulgaris]|uniref:Uncharacterized protein n=2 Tax=Vespula TaxID=7451 RepID=A0A834NY44_VESPE|nr:hypothetical protein HZH66_008673 [Vespula vulgaris]KAF7420581.1 hypothetical protein H0235_010878 [Vespula pensylvanica]
MRWIVHTVWKVRQQHLRRSSSFRVEELEEDILRFSEEPYYICVFRFCKFPFLVSPRNVNKFYDRLPACVYMLPANSSSDCIAMAMAAAAVMAPAPAPTAAAAMAGHIEVHRT